MAGEILSARRPFVAVVAGKTIRVNRGDLFAADDPVVGPRREKFESPKVRSTVPLDVTVPVAEVEVTRTSGGGLLQRVRGPGGRFQPTKPQA